MPCCMLVWVTWVQIGCTNDCIKRCGCGIYRTPMIVELEKKEKKVLEIPTNDSYQPLNHRTEKPKITKTHAGRRPCAAGPTEQGVPLVPAEILLEGWLDQGRHHCSESLLGNPVAEGRTKSSLRFVAKLLHFFLVVNNIWTSEKSNKKATKTWHLCNYFNCRKHAHINMATQKDRKWNPSKIGQIRGRLLSFGGCHMLLWTNNLNDNQSSQYFI